MKVLTLGSIHIDYNYSVGHITTLRETQMSNGVAMSPGGKGLNQALALTRAGLKVQLAGMVGTDGAEILDMIQQAGVDTSLIRTVEGPTGHAIIQVDEMGQNAVLVYSGANQMIDEAYIDEILEAYEEGDVLVLQNETSCVEYAINRAYEKGMSIVLNPSPYTPELMNVDLNKVSIFCLNKTIGRAMTGYIQPGDILLGLEERYPNGQFIFTLGSKGAFYKKGSNQWYHPAVPVLAVDSTAVDDVFEGYFLAAYFNGKSPAEALKYASYAEAMAVTTPGTAYFATPYAHAVEEYMQNFKHHSGK